MVGGHAGLNYGEVPFPEVRMIGKLAFPSESTPADNKIMRTIEKTPAVDPQVLADRQAAFDHRF